MEQKIRSLKIPFFSKDIKESEERFEKIKEEYDFQKLAKLGTHIPSRFFLKAMNILELSFEELNGNFDFESKNEFIEKYLRNIDVCFSKKQEFNQENNLEIAKFVLENFKAIKQSTKQEYEVTPFETHKLNLGNRVLFRSEDKIAYVNYDWLYYNDLSLDSDLEKEFLYFIEGNKDVINTIFSQWFIVRNDGFEEFKLFDNRKDELNTYGYGFEPDFIFFGKKKGENDKFLSVECFFEAKGEHLKIQDAWKEEFLGTIKNAQMQVEVDKNLILYSLPFFLSKEIKQNAKFIDAFDEFLERKLF